MGAHVPKTALGGWRAELIGSGVKVGDGGVGCAAAEHCSWWVIVVVEVVVVVVWLLVLIFRCLHSCVTDNDSADNRTGQGQAWCSPLSRCRRRGCCRSLAVEANSTAAAAVALWL